MAEYGQKKRRKHGDTISSSSTTNQRGPEYTEDSSIDMTVSLPNEREAAIKIITRYNQYGKDRVTGVTVSMEVATSQYLHLSHERDFDRFMKFIGTATEHQTGDAAFDSKFYIGSDNVKFTQHLFMSSKNRDDLVRLFKYDARHMTIENNRLSLLLEPEGIGLFGNPDYLNKMAKQKCAEIAQIMFDWQKAALPSVDHPEEDKGMMEVLGSLFTKKPGTSFAIAAIIGWLSFYLLINRHGVLPSEPLFLKSAVYSIPAIVASFALAFFMFKGSSLSHWRFINFGTLLSCLSATFAINQYLAENKTDDMSVPQSHIFKIQGKVTRSHRYTLTSYNLVLDRWIDGTPAYEFPVSEKDYNRIYKGNCLRIEIKQGKNDLKWVSAPLKQGTCGTI